MRSFINKLKEIEKDKLDERSFYEQVLSVIQGMEDVSLTPETAKQLKMALQEIGCMRYDEWKAEKDKNGETIEENNTGKGREQADIATAVSFVSQLLGDYGNASSSLSRMLEGGEKYGWVQRWLKNSSEYSKKITPTAAVKSALKGTTAIKSAKANDVEQSELNPKITKEGEEIDD